MSTNIEIEAKALVNEKDFNKFVKHFSKTNNKSYVQVNYYIDDVDLSLANHGISLRVRKKKDEYELTLKTPLSEGLLEKNQNLKQIDFDLLQKNKKFPDGDIKRFLTMLGMDISIMRIMTSLTTTRIDIEYKDGLLSLDRNEYNKKKDFEIEYEYNSEVGAVKILKKLFQELKVPYKANKVSKVVRAFNSLK